MNIGVDIEDIKRFENSSETLLDKIFTDEEKKYCLSKAKSEQHFAVRFCAKEAVIKALSAYGIKNVYMTDIEIYHDENDCPNVRILKDYGKSLEFKLSLSHDRTKAIAFVTAE